MSEVPTPVNESTAIEFKRLEGSTLSDKSIGTITAGEILWWPNNSGLRQADGNETVRELAGVALYDAASGKRAVTARGLLRVRWDGAGTLNRGVPIGVSTTRSGWFEPVTIASLSGGGSGLLSIGHYPGLGGDVSNPGAGQSGTLLIVDIL